ncbi:cyclin-like protein [Lipomyces japonicus]|uniref:cyclin-like protein n=1 Tax=Lipomyces japonicus TaxID=56871 RepID=UPI0034CDD892
MYAYPISPAESTYSVKQARSMRLREIERRAVQIVEEEYSEEIEQCNKQVELDRLPDVNMIELQPELEWYMRPYLLDFLVESHLSLRLLPQTLFLAVNLIDRYCSRRVVFKKHYQLVGCAALWIASKYEDKKDRVPTARELKIMCCDAYEEDMFVQMEGHVLSTLEWSIGSPTCDIFVKQSLKNSNSDTLENLSLYLCEMALFQKSFLGFRPSVIASAAQVVAKHILQNRAGLAAATSADEAQCIALLSQYLMFSPSQSLQKKYSSPAFSQVALILQDFVVRQQHATSVLPPTPPPTDECIKITTPTNITTLPPISHITRPHSPEEPCSSGYV